MSKALDVCTGTFCFTYMPDGYSSHRETLAQGHPEKCVRIHVVAKQLLKQPLETAQRLFSEWINSGQSTHWNTIQQWKTKMLQLHMAWKHLGNIMWGQKCISEGCLQRGVIDVKNQSR